MAKGKKTGKRREPAPPSKDTIGTRFSPLDLGRIRYLAETQDKTRSEVVRMACDFYFRANRGELPPGDPLRRGEQEPPR